MVRKEVPVARGKLSAPAQAEQEDGRPQSPPVQRTRHPSTRATTLGTAGNATGLPNGSPSEFSPCLRDSHRPQERTMTRGLRVGRQDTPPTVPATLEACTQSGQGKNKPGGQITKKKQMLRKIGRPVVRGPRTQWRRVVHRTRRNQPCRGRFLEKLWCGRWEELIPSLAVPFV